MTLRQIEDASIGRDSRQDRADVEGGLVGARPKRQFDVAGERQRRREWAGRVGYYIPAVVDFRTLLHAARVGGVAAERRRWAPGVVNDRVRPRMRGGRFAEEPGLGRSCQSVGARVEVAPGLPGPMIEIAPGLGDKVEEPDRRRLVDAVVDVFEEAIEPGDLQPIDEA